MKRTTTHSNTFKFAIAISIIFASAAAVSAAPKLDAVSYDPDFISAGDRVNISANIHETDLPDKVWDEDKKLKVILKPGNRLTEEYVTIEDDRDRSIGFLYPEGVWNQRFQVKVDSGAPTGTYDFDLHIQYLENGQPVKIETEGGEMNYTVLRKFSMPVDNEGVELSSNLLSTKPSVPRPGDNYVEARVRFTNTGNKPVEEIDIRPSTPKEIDPSYSSDEKFFIDKLMEGSSSEKTISFNLDDELDEGLHKVNLSADYEDESGNTYEDVLELPLRVEGRPDLELVDSKMEMKAGSTSELHVQIENVGEQDAESVTARLIAERSQPFSLNDRSNYVGEIPAGETGEAVMQISADRTAALKTHNLKIQLRANGDSEEGDQSVYTFTEESQVEIKDRTQSMMVYLGIAAALLVAVAAAYRYRSSKSSDNQEEEIKVE